MSIDKRSVVTDALKTLGTIITVGESRDAIHLAVEPVVAAYTLKPGQHVGFVDKDRRVGIVGNPLGIVDPFLTSNVEEGQVFWLIVYPRQITSLRHFWQHPAFDTPPEIDEVAQRHLTARHFITLFAKEIRSSFEAVMEHADNYVEHGDYWSEGGRFEGQYLPKDFWDYYETLRGKRPDNDWSFFSCSC